MKKTLFFPILLFAFINVFAEDKKVNVPLPDPSFKVLYTIPGSDFQENRKIFEINPTPEIKIDGVLNEQIKTHPLIIRNGKSITAKIYFSYNNNGLYLFADVSDASPALNKNTKEKINMGDSIELLINFGTFYHIGIKASEKKELWNWTLKAPVDRENTVYKKTKNGYVIESQIPWHNFMMGCLCSLRNKNLDFNIIINDKTYNNNLVKYKWCNDDGGCGYVVFR
ncbi:MAG: hypothetical protein KA120_06575 [Candidatus Goldbacteria bacterium]|nr:hypothetical protein [Candidatus Goldiibacteriota bacterium]